MGNPATDIFAVTSTHETLRAKPAEAYRSSSKTWGRVSAAISLSRIVRLAGAVTLLVFAPLEQAVHAQTLFYATSYNGIGGDDTPSGILKFAANGSYTTWDITWDQPGLDLFDPRGIALDLSGNVYVNDGANILKIDPAGNGTRFALKPNAYYGYGVTVDVSGNVYAVGASNSEYAVYKYNSAGENVAVWAYGYGSNMSNLVIGPDGAIYTGDYFGNTIHRIDPVTGIRTAFRSLDGAGDVAFDSAGNLYATGYSSGQRVYKFTPAGVRSNAITNGLRTAYGLGVGADGKIYVSDNNSNWTNEIRVRTATGAANSSTVFAALDMAHTLTGIAMVPEPSSASLALTALLGSVAFARRRRG